MTSGAWTSLLWFIAILALIPATLWFLKRTPLGGAGSSGILRSVAVLPLSASQRIVTIEVGAGEERRWLVLGITPGSITTLHSMAPLADEAPPAPGMQAPPFAQLLGRLRGTTEPTDKTRDL
jgi:flagellar protein FliO/FliZ